VKIIQSILGGLVYALLWSANTLYALVPANKAYAFGAAVARAVYPLFPRRRRIAIDNILKAKITDDPEEADRIGRRAWDILPAMSARRSRCLA